MTKLKEYESKRDFDKSPEPQGKKQKNEQTKKAKSIKKVNKNQIDKKIFVIQFHRATRDHYDFRLEYDGVLLSFAVPKGLSLNPKVKRLAVHVEDHPISYADFSGLIPKGNYGAGTVEIFDKGYYTEVQDFKKGLKKGHLKFVLFGEKFTGEWSLIKTDEKNWLIVKSDDKYAKKDEKIASTQKNPFKKTKPMLALLTDKIQTGKNWLFEIKYDGYRILAFIENNKVGIYSKNYTDYSMKFDEIGKSLLLQAKGTSTVLDGEVVCFDESGKSDFGLLQHNIKTKQGGFVYVVFDILAFNGEDLREKPLIERKEILEAFLVKCPKNILYSSHVIGKGKESFNLAKKLNLEGVIAKKINSKYSGTRNGDWLKIKCVKRQEFIIGGYTKTEKNDVLSAILVGYYEKDKLIYAGKVGTGFNEELKKELVAKFNKVKSNSKTFGELKETDAIWLKPELLAEIKFAEMTKSGNLRQPVFVGLREDKNPKSVNLEGFNEE